MMKGLHRTKKNIDYCYYSGDLIGREGYVLNLVTGCWHWDKVTFPGRCNIPCYARELVLHGRLKGSPSYPYGFEPTFHPERIRKIGGKPKLIFLNDMGDVGGKWKWRAIDDKYQQRHYATGQDVYYSTEDIAIYMKLFADLNPQHILLLLTKNPAWYALADWPENVWCGFSATNNEVFGERWLAIKQTGVKRNRMWVSLEPWLDWCHAPDGAVEDYFDWIVIGGLTDKMASPGRAFGDNVVSWIQNFKQGRSRLFVKKNARLTGTPTAEQYPAAWRIP